MTPGANRVLLEDDPKIINRADYRPGRMADAATHEQRLRRDRQVANRRGRARGRAVPPRDAPAPPRSDREPAPPPPDSEPAAGHPELLTHSSQPIPSLSARPSSPGAARFR